MTVLTARAGIVIMLLLGGGSIAACGTLIHTGDIDTFENRQFPGSRFDSISVIAASEHDNSLMMARRVRESLTQNGIAVVEVQGLWQTEASAITGICRAYLVQGVATVDWNRITLRDCETETVAFNADGGYAGLEAMTQRLIDYLRGR